MCHDKQWVEQIVHIAYHIHNVYAIFANSVLLDVIVEVTMLRNLSMGR